MGHTICISSLKGGVGKTTTAVNLAAYLAHAGKKTLLIDCDAQGSATTTSGILKKNSSFTLADAFKNKTVLRKIVAPSLIEKMKVIPTADLTLSTESEFMAKPDWELRLKNLLIEIKKEYDFIVIDTPPASGFLTINGMVASDSVLIPLQCEYLAYTSLIRLLNFIRHVKETRNSDMKLGGILLTMCDETEPVSQKIVKNVRTHMKSLVFDGIIPKCAKLHEASGFGKPILLKFPESSGAKSYQCITIELMKRIETGRMHSL